MVRVQTWAAGVGAPGSPLPHLPQSQSQSQKDGLVVGDVLSGLAAVPAAPAGVGQMMTGGLSLAPGGQGPALGAEDPTTMAQTPAGLFPGAVV